MKTQRIVILLLVLVLIVGLEVVMMSRCTREDGPEAAVPTAEPTAPVETVQPVETTTQPTLPPVQVGVTSPPSNPGGNTQSSTNTQTSTATKAPTPTQAPTPTPAPTQPPTSGTVVASNSFSSDTGTGLNLNISWQAADQGNGTTRVYVTGKVSSYSLDVGSRSVSISLGGYSTSVTGSSISVPDGGMQTNQLFYTYLDVPTGTDGNMSVSWAFKGSYSGTDLPTIDATGYVYTD